MDLCGWRFWLVLAGLSVTSLLTAIESTVTSTTLPTISLDLNMGGTYIWVVNALFLSRLVSAPLPSFPRSTCQFCLFQYRVPAPLRTTRRRLRSMMAAHLSHRPVCLG